MHLTVFTSQRSNVYRVILFFLAFIFHVNSFSSPYPIRIEREPRGSAIDLVVYNDGPAYLNIVLELTRADNVGFSPAVIGSKYPHFIPANSSKKITTAVALKPTRPAAFAYRYKYAFGDPTAEHENFFYRLPIPDGTRGVVKPYAGDYVNNFFVNTSNAVEVLLPLNTPIVASRDGVVFNARGLKGKDDTQTLTSLGNFVMVLHDDGTWATYGWLADDSVIVNPGDHVKAGQQLALSGLNPTSYETYTYFGVNRNFFALELRGVPIKLKTFGAEAFDVLSYNGPVSPNLPAKYKAPHRDDDLWFPPPSLAPLPKQPVDYNDEDLTPVQRQALFRKRINDAADEVGADSISGSRPLIALAVIAAVLGTIGLVAAISIVFSSKSPGLRRALWFMFRGGPPSGNDPVVHNDSPSMFHSLAIAIASPSPTPTQLPSPPSIQPDHKDDESTQVPQSDHDAPAVKIFGQDKLRLLQLINQSIPSTYICAQSIHLSSLVPHGLSKDLLSAPVDFVLVRVDTQEAVAAILFLADPAIDRQLSMLISQSLSIAGVPTITFDSMPKISEVKARIKRLV